MRVDTTHGPREIAAGDLIGREVFYQAPLYPYFLGNALRDRGTQPADCARLSGSNWHGLVRVARTHGSPSVFGTSRLDRRVSGLPSMRLSCSLTACFRSPCWICFLCPSRSGSSAVLSTNRTARSRWFWLGMAMGALALTRENALILVVGDSVVAAWTIAV